MQGKLVLIDRQALRAELRQVFDARTARTLLSVLDKVAAQVRAAGVMREDFGELKQIVAELAEAQRRTGQRVEELAEAQRRSEERLGRLESNIVILTEQVRALVASQQTIVDEVGGLKGRVLELAYRDKAVAYFGRLLRRPGVVDLNSLWEALEAHLAPDELDDVLLVDLVVQGRPRQRADLGDVWLAVEVSSVVDEGDVARARRRAELLRQAGYRAVPVVAGERATLSAEDEARQHKVVVLQNGRSFLWDEALATWAA